MPLNDCLFLGGPSNGQIRLPERELDDDYIFTEHMIEMGSSGRYEHFKIATHSSYPQSGSNLESDIRRFHFSPYLTE